MFNSIVEIKPFSAYHLKIIALTCMIFDHIGAAIFNYDVPMLNNIGRLAFPLFAFTLAQSCKYTKSQLQLLVRLSSFAIISEIPFDLAFGITPSIDFFNHTNVFFTLSLAVGCIYIYEKLKYQNRNVQISMFLVFVSFLTLEWILLSQVTSERISNVLVIYTYIICVVFVCTRLADNRHCSKEVSCFSKILPLFPIIPLLIQAAFIKCDYDILGVLLIVLLYLANSQKSSIIILVIGMIILYGIELRNIAYLFFSLLSIILVYFYNGKRGSSIKWCFYWVYPLHITILAILRSILLI